jgi:hypothetical protein
MRSFGLITEGESDQIVIENILYGVLKDSDLFFAPLQPPPGISGSWGQVFNYCCSEEFKQGIGYNDYFIIQMDTDILKREKLPDEYKIDLPNELSEKEVVERVVQKFISLIDDENHFWDNYGHKIIFAISVDEIECWLLPIYFKNRPKDAAKTTGCKNALNRVLKQREGFYIHSKKYEYYSTMSKHFRKKIYDLYPMNPSLKIFVENILEIKKAEDEEE